MLAHWLELSPSLVTVNDWLSSPLSPSCSSSCVTCAMTGTAARASIAKSAANNISFFNFTPPYERVFMDVAYSFINILYCQYLKCSFFLLFLKKLNISGGVGELNRTTSSCAVPIQGYHILCLIESSPLHGD